MIEQLQAVLNKHEEQEETIQRLQSRNLILADERDKLAQRVAELEVFQQKVSQVPALENKITRLMYNAEKLAGKLNLAEGELKIFRGEGNPAKLKKTIKDLKAEKAELKAANERLKADSKKVYKDNKALAAFSADMTSQVELMKLSLVKSKRTFRLIDDWQVMLWPAKMSLSHEEVGKISQMLAILIVAPCGAAALVTTIGGHMVVPPEFKPSLEKIGGIPDSVQDFVCEWLGKAERQGYALTENDYLVFAEIEC